MKKDIPVAVVILPALLILAAVGYFLVLKPKQDAAGRLGDEIVSLEAQIQLAQAAQRQPAGDETAIQVADAFRVSKALPDDEDMAGIILELESMATSSGVRFISITPQAATVRTSYSALPINVEFTGSFYDLTDFLFRLRNLVGVRDGELSAAGRLYSLDALTMEMANGGFPNIDASMTLTAYYYSTTPPDAPVVPAAPTTTDTSATTTTAPEGEASVPTP